jgi:uncharacterized membrane protein
MNGLPMGWDWWTWFALMLFMVLFSGFVLWSVMALFYAFREPEPSQAEPPEGPGEILARRLARGEIQPEEYLHRLKVVGLRSPAQDNELGSDGKIRGTAANAPG